MGINYSKFHEQTVDSYRYVDYGGNSIYNSGCGPASLANALMVLGIADMTVKDACEFAVFCGARIRDAGTNMSTLLKHAAEKWPITYRTTSSNAELAAHLRAGGVAIMNQGDTYKVFSNGGHYVVAAAIDNADRVTVIDSYWNTKKYKTWPKYHAKSEILSRCFVRTPLYWCGRATAGRDPSYYLISKKTEKKPVAAKKEDNEMVEKTTFEIGGEKFTLDAITKNGTTYVCLKQYNNVLGLDTGYDVATDTRAVDFDQLNISVDGSKHTVHGLIAGKGHSFASVPELLKLTGCDVGWDSQSNCVTVKTPEITAEGGTMESHKSTD